MKYLLTSLICLFLLVCVPNATAENGRTWPVQEQVQTWSAGDIIQVGVLCKNEDTILEIVNADIKSEKDVLLQINESLIEGVCVTFPMPTMFIVIKALVHYKDHIERESVVLGVANADRNFLGWTLANGKFVEKIKGQII